MELNHFLKATCNANPLPARAYTAGSRMVSRSKYGSCSKMTSVERTTQLLEDQTHLAKPSSDFGMKSTSRD